MMSDWRRADTQWFHDAKFGTFTHYLADSASNREPVAMTPDQWNRRVDSFDVDAFAQRLAETGSRYHFLTLGQNSGYQCSPNETYDNIVGRAADQSRLSRRDLVLDLALALEKVNIRAMVYITSHAPAMDREAIEAFKCTPRWDMSRTGIIPGMYLAGDDVDERLSEFQKRWEAVVREWSTRWGKHVHGWWVDGCYYDQQLYRHADAPNFRSFAQATKAGNPDALVAFNPGVKMPVISYTPYEDYTAGELNEMATHNKWRAMGRFIDGAQFHVLSYLGDWWGEGEPRYPDDLASGYTRYITDHNGVVTWDVPVSAWGVVPEAYMRQLTRIGHDLFAA